MGTITLADAAAWCGGTVDPKYGEISFFGANNDSRNLKPGQLFLALEGARDGHDFIPAAMTNGAAAVLCTHCQEDIPAIYVSDVRKALGSIARQERLRLGMQVVGITGSVGKSTTKEMVAAVLERKYRVQRTPVNHNNDVGMPMAILGMPEDTQIAVLEMGMNHFREIAYLTSIARPNYAIITNIGTMHIEHLGSQEGILRAKLEILEGMNEQGRLFVNGDDPLLSHLDPGNLSLTLFGKENSACQVMGTDVEETEGGLRFQVRTGDRTLPIELKLEGTHFISDALAAVSLGFALEVPPEEITKALRDFHNMEGRQEILEQKGLHIIKDFYNAGPESMAAALEVLGKRKGRRIAVLGDMLELGSCTQAEHYRVGRIAAEKADLVFAYGPNGERVVSGALTGGMAKSQARSFVDCAALAAALKRVAKEGDVLLFKGSHGMRMEKVLDLFLREEP